MTVSEPSALDLALLESPGTVTHFLETLTGERIVADVVHQYPVTASAGNYLGVTAGHAMTHRTAVLKGRTTDRPYLCAESTFVPERLPEKARSQLERTSDPIGHVLVTHGLSLHREPLPQPERIGPSALGGLAEFAPEIVWSRSYRLMVDGLPTFAIREWFLRSVLDELDRQDRGEVWGP
ncbi:MAG: chorismate--pyruvate lyase family protein [Acidimicrobiales bacterium]